MVKDPKKAQELQPTIINNVSTENNTPPKSRQQIYSENYQKNKEKKKAQQKERYAQRKNQAQLTINQQLRKYYQANSIKVLMSLKDYTELNKDKKKL